MSLPLTHPVPATARKIGALNAVALIAWGIVIAVLAFLIARAPHKASILTVYETGGQRWLDSELLYQNYRGFIYSPLAAAFFVPFKLMPDFASNFLWRILNAGVYLASVLWWLKSGFHRIPPRIYGAVFLLLVPLSVGNLNIGQVNPLIIGLLLASVVAAHRQRWALSAFCVAFATYFKIYPLAVGLLLAVLYARRFSVWLALALIALGLLPFALQRPSYALDQYHAWIASRSADNRRLYAQEIAPCDLYMLLKLCRIHISERVYLAIQLLSGAAIALMCAVGRWKSWPEERLLVSMFSLVSCWMLLCGPATESATYVMLAPAVALALVASYCAPAPLFMRGLVTVSFALLFASFAMGSFGHRKKEIFYMSVQPLGAALFTVYAVAWVVRYRKIEPTG